MTSVLTSVSTGNTKPVEPKLKARNFLITVNEKSLEFIDYIFEYLEHYKSLTYLLCCEHIGQENKHYHIYVQFNNLVKLNIHELKGSHIDVCFGSPQQNVQYVKALDEKHLKLNITSKLIYEVGTLRKSGAKTYQEFEKMSIEERKQLSYTHSKIIQQMNQKQQEEDELKKLLEEIKQDKLKEPEIIYLTGPSGTGKTYTAYKIATNKYDVEDIGKININNNFFKIVNENAKCFIIEEFRSTQLYPSEFLQFIDKYGYSANIKGSFQFLRPECIIICSIINPFDLYKNDEVNKQFIRRINKCYTIDSKHELEEVDLKYYQDIKDSEESELNDLNLITV